MKVYYRRSLRLQNYDYAQAGAYFVTLCTHNRINLFGEIAQGEMHLSMTGQIVVEEWQRSTEIRREIELDEWVAMPNHLHGIVVIKNTDGRDPAVGAHGRAPLLHRPPRSLGSFIAGFKSSAIKRINEIRQTPGVAVWQRNYYEHVVRDATDLHRIREYIASNVLRWQLDEYYRR
ncbi:MAG: hypothetical protein JNL09_02220 [Anaerolineales bacterium]|nr:hypothetical protein [Anaerolineales bacterium]